MPTEWREILGQVAGILALLAFIPYIYSTIRGSVEPSRVTWITWSFVQFILTVTFWQSSGNHEAIWVSIGYTVGTILTAFLSIKYGHNDKLDKVSLIGISGTIIIYCFVGSLGGLMAILIIDAWASLPTIKKSKTKPKTESLSSWMIGFGANALNLIVLTHWNEWAILYPLYLFVLEGTISYLLISGRRRRRRELRELRELRRFRRLRRLRS